MELGGQVIEAGQKVTLWEMSANRDERAFEDPFRFDVGRSPNLHVGFGFGTHFCLGASLARLEIRIILEELLDRFERFEVDRRDGMDEQQPPRRPHPSTSQGLSEGHRRLRPRRLTAHRDGGRAREKNHHGV